jgi:hypothetical protein
MKPFEQVEQVDTNKNNTQVEQFDTQQNPTKQCVQKLIQQTNE